ncbi:MULTISPECIES: hypothetical protein [Enterobacteriaceae]|uniref:hypothetical protein n=1 Tax=Enterobacteriaceae TaxID=543 RepID=UPI002949AE79|nr:hypothetical protein [Leclercia adecarboxylata]MDV5280137.1 hypothetical protein [Leclercia adecarboxylata]MDV5464043.1 hypothetical protein [Leclercia adecarboxylata]MDV5505875.1 hypothetical protein [Leclercia adecarboxylata]MDV5534843.1 hypothetical protein [Leclercia adecarboxylata]MDV5593519.1 hypothetical protein [Leclercia adecarboxylata]
MNNAPDPLSAIKKHLANRWRDSSAPVIIDAEPAADPMTAAKRKISNNWRKK